MGLIFQNTAVDLIGLCVIAITLAYFYIKHLYSYWQRRGVKSVQGSFPFGNFGPIFRQQASFGEVTTAIYKQTNEPVIGVYSAVHPTLIVRDPELVRAVFTKDFQHFHDRGVYINEKIDPLSGHLFSLAGEKWKNLRAKLTPTFTSGKLKAMFSTLVECGAALTNFMDKVAAAEKIVEMREILAQYTTNVIASVAFGIDINCIGEPNSAFRKYGRKVFEPTLRNGIRGAMSFMFPGVLKFFNIKALDQDVEDFMISIVKQSLHLRENENLARKDFFQLLVQLRNTGRVLQDGEWNTTILKDEMDKKLTVNEVAAQSFIFYVAGFETSSTTMSFALYELARNPECQRRVQQEIDDTLRKHQGQITFDAVSEMKYLDHCIDETLRLYPPLPILNRECTKNWTIPNTNIIIEKGTFIFIPAHALQTDPKYYPDPESFKPERFSAEELSDKSFIDRPYMPFGEGPRNCIGLRFGKMQSKVGLILMLQNYSYHLAGNTLEPIKLSPNSIVTAAVGGLELKVTKRAK